MRANGEYFQLIERRLEENDELFYLQLQIVSECNGYSITKRKRWFGVNDGANELIPPIYDEVRVCNADIFLLLIEDAYVAYDNRREKMIPDFVFLDCKAVGNYLIFKSRDNTISLYDTERGVFVFKGGYDEVNPAYLESEYFWIRKGRFYSFVHRETGRVVSLVGCVFPYDTDIGMAGLLENGRVAFFDSDGNVSMERLRTEVRSKNGYCSLYNYAYKKRHIIDIYGNILNE